MSLFNPLSVTSRFVRMSRTRSWQVVKSEPLEDETQSALREPSQTTHRDFREIIEGNNPRPTDWQLPERQNWENRDEVAGFTTESVSRDQQAKDSDPLANSTLNSNVEDENLVCLSSGDEGDEIMCLSHKSSTFENTIGQGYREAGQSSSWGISSYNAFLRSRSNDEYGDRNTNVPVPAEKITIQPMDNSSTQGENQDQNQDEDEDEEISEYRRQMQKNLELSKKADKSTQTYEYEFQEKQRCASVAPSDISSNCNFDDQPNQFGTNNDSKNDSMLNHAPRYYNNNNNFQRSHTSLVRHQPYPSFSTNRSDSPHQNPEVNNYINNRVRYLMRQYEGRLMQGFMRFMNFVMQNQQNQTHQQNYSRQQNYTQHQNAYHGQAGNNNYSSNNQGGSNYFSNNRNFYQRKNNN